MTENPENDCLDSDFDQLLAKAREGSPAARNELFAHVQRYLAFIANQNHNPQLSAKAGASDIVQQTMLHAAEELDSFRGSSAEQFRGWLRQILVNEARGLNRHFGAQRRNASQEVEIRTGDSSNAAPFELADSMLTPSAEIMAKENSVGIQALLEKLSPEMRQVVQLRNWEQLQFNEIAEHMGITLSQAAKLWYNALIELQRLHSEMNHDQSRQ
ncbi:MAG: sigma-70 family RNA polymerase sigma factor [Pirellulaceae bacterium]